jgi:hypothetical protein
MYENIISSINQNLQNKYANKSKYFIIGFIIITIIILIVVVILNNKKLDDKKDKVKF